MMRSAFAIGLLLASTAASAVPPGFKAKADQLLANAYAANGPGAAVIVTENGKTVYAAGRGMADIGAGRAIKPGDSFRLGSITKQFAAATLLKLIEQGKLSLDDPLSKFIPDYPAPGASVTVRQLLNHTSGIADYTAIPGWMVEANTAKAYTSPQLIDVFKDKPAAFKPGEHWAYDNSGYILVGAIIEKVTGKPWDDAVTDAITRPLHLTSIRSGVGEASISTMVKGYTDKDGKAVPATIIHMSVPGAAGALVGDAEDLATWADALHNGKVVNAATYQAMITPTKTSDGKTASYGFGLEIEDVRGEKAIGHNGGIFGFSTDSIYLPKQKLFVAVFANSDSPKTQPGTLAQRLAAVAIGDPFPTLTKTAVDMKAVEPMLGVYKFDDTERTFFARGGKLFTKRTGGGEIEAFAAGRDRFFYGPDDLTYFEVIPGAKGKQIGFHRNGSPQGAIGVRTGPVPTEAPQVAVPPATLDVYAGDYTSIAGTFVIKHEGEGLTVKLAAQPTFPLKAISLTEFKIVGIPAKIRFNVKDGKAGSITLFQGGQELEGVRSN